MSATGIIAQPAAAGLAAPRAGRPVLSIRGLTVALPRSADRAFAVQDLNLDLHAGEITCLVGESGSGKSMVARAILRLLPERTRITAGQMQFGESDLARLTEAQMQGLRGAKIGMVFQEPMTALNPLHPVGKQVAEVLRLHTKLGPRQRRRRAIELLGDMRLPDPARLFRSYPHQLSGGQRQRVVISMALALRPSLLIADEPTTALDVTTQAQILDLLRALQREHGMAILFITHDFGVVRQIADRVAVLQNGILVERGRCHSVLSHPAHGYTRMLLSAVPALAPPHRPERPHEPAILEAVYVGKTFRRPGSGGRTQALEDVRLVLSRGETLGIVGESGSGKSTLARILCGLMRPDAGEVLLEGQPTSQLSCRALRPLRKRIQMVFQDPYGSLDPRQTVGSIVAEGPIIHGVRARVARARAGELLRLVGLDEKAAQRYPHEFSGGQRQRIGLARALALEPDILVADEPVSALDVSVQAQVLQLMEHLKVTLGVSMVFITHDLRVAMQMCDRIAVMRAGEVVEVGTARQIYDAPSHPYTRALFAAVPGAEEPVVLTPALGDAIS